MAFHSTEVSAFSNFLRQLLLVHPFPTILSAGFSMDSLSLSYFLLSCDFVPFLFLDSHFSGVCRGNRYKNKFSSCVLPVLSLALSTCSMSSVLLLTVPSTEWMPIRKIKETPDRDLYPILVIFPSIVFSNLFQPITKQKSL